jgi:hypothetical protein
MGDQRRPQTITSQLVFRTYRLSRQLRETVKRRRRKLRLTVREFIQHAVETELADLVKVINRELPNLTKKDDPPARLPLTAPLLDKLQAACDTTGIPVTRLLLVSLHKAAARKRRRTR